ncbi:MAG: DUF1801 domain-containing protein [Caldithrix sp.]|nr:DUF1801 domain-containing protein [Caldithrix sp.]
MQSNAETPELYIEDLPDDRKPVIQKLRAIILDNLPAGFAESMNYGMIGYVVPHSVYPPGYHCNTQQPLPFMNLASQKNYIALYHMGIFADSTLHEWFTQQYINQTGKKPDMGKSCIRFKNLKNIPFDLIGELAGKMSSQKWIEIYESNIKR